MQPNPAPAGLADPRRAFRHAIERLRPARRVSVADCAAQHRRLSNEGGGYVGKWQHERVPYLVEPMNAAADRDKRVVAVVGPGQSAKTTIFENLVLHAFAYQPRDVLWFMQTEEELDHYTRTRARTLVDLHDPIRDEVAHGEDNQFTKASPRMRVTWFPANNATLIAKAAPVVLLDEIDAYKKGLGDVVTKVRVRVQTFGRDGKVVVVSHPDRAGADGIAAIYELSDQRRWFMPCPHCSEWSAALATVRQGATPTVLAWELSADVAAAEACATRTELAAALPAIAARAALQCPCCGGLVEESQRLAVVRAGKWVGEGQAIAKDGTVAGALLATDVAGFHIAGIMSPFVTLGDLARGLAEARWEYEHEGDDAKLREVTSKRLGQLYDRAAATGQVRVGDAELEQQQLAAAWKGKTVPAGVRFLTASVDVQGRAFAVTVLGWGAGAEAWLVDRFDVANVSGTVNVRPADAPEHWDVLLPLFTAAYPLAADATKELPVALVAIDTGGEPGVADNAKAFGRKVLASSVPGPFSLVPNAGDRATLIPDWRLMLVKGAANAKAEPVPKAPTFEKDDKGKVLKDAAPVWVIGVDRIKRVLDTRRSNSAATGAAGPGVLHLPVDFDPRWRRELVAEQLEDDAWVRSGANETWDGWVYGEAGRLRLRPDRHDIDWARPPTWATPRKRVAAPPPPTVANPVRPAPGRRPRSLADLRR